MWNTPETIVGQCFQNHVESLFLDDCFKIINYSQMRDPDFTVEHIPSHDQFCVECKFRSNFSHGKIYWAARDDIFEYQSFSEQNNICTFIIIGVENFPCKPRKMYCIPLEEASQYTRLFESFLQRYERDPNKKFSWKGGNLE